MKIFGGIRRAAIATWRFISPVYWYDFHRIRIPPDGESSTPIDDEPREAAPPSAELASQAPGVETATRARHPWKAPEAVVTSDALPRVSLLRAWTTCKDPLLPDSNEDAWAWVSQRSAAAVFDGATESFAARRWVGLLKEAWSNEPSIDLATLQHRYAEAIQAMSLSWAQEQAADRGSYTTLASVTPTPGGLQATCIGDSAILLLKDGSITQAYPSMDAADYSSVPDALGSTTDVLDLGEELLRTCTWTIPVNPGDIDTVMLATDACAVWLLDGDEPTRQSRLQAIMDIESDEQWEGLVQDERRAKRMKTDDSTVLVLAVEGSA